jgi:hypothetical protein
MVNWSTFNVGQGQHSEHQHVNIPSVSVLPGPLRTGTSGSFEVNIYLLSKTERSSPPGRMGVFHLCERGEEQLSITSWFSILITCRVDSLRVP